MDMGKLLKILGVVVVLVIALPFALKLLPKPVTFERVKAAFEQAGMTVSNYREAPTPSNEAVAEASMIVDGAQVQIWKYDDEGKIVRYEGYQKADPGQSIVASWGLAESLGAAVQKPTPHSFQRKGMFLIVATSEDKGLNDRIVSLFGGL